MKYLRDKTAELNDSGRQLVNMGTTGLGATAGAGIGYGLTNLLGKETRKKFMGIPIPSTGVGEDGMFFGRRTGPLTGAAIGGLLGGALGSYGGRLGTSLGLEPEGSGPPAQSPQAPQMDFGPLPQDYAYGADNPALNLSTEELLSLLQGY